MFGTQSTGGRLAFRVLTVFRWLSRRVVGCLWESQLASFPAGLHSQCFSPNEESSAGSGPDTLGGGVARELPLLASRLHCSEVSFS